MLIYIYQCWYIYIYIYIYINVDLYIYNQIIRIYIILIVRIPPLSLHSSPLAIALVDIRCSRKVGEFQYLLVDVSESTGERWSYVRSYSTSNAQYVLFILLGLFRKCCRMVSCKNPYIYIYIYIYGLHTHTHIYVPVYKINEKINTWIMWINYIN